MTFEANERQLAIRVGHRRKLLRERVLDAYGWPIHKIALIGEEVREGSSDMWLAKGDFSIKTENFDLSNGLNIIRITCGLFLFPHVVGKFSGGTLSPGIVAFFSKAGFHPPEVWVCIAAFLEFVTGLALILGICTRFAALVALSIFLVAVYALQVANGFGWTWNTGGYEYPVFWAIMSLAVAIEAWKTHLRPASGTEMQFSGAMREPT